MRPRRLMTGGTSVGRGRMVHLRRFPVRLIVTTPAIVYGAAVMRILVAFQARPIEPGPTIAGVARDTLQAGMDALELTLVFRGSGLPAFQCMTPGATRVFRAVAPPLMAVQTSRVLLGIVVPAMTGLALHDSMTTGKKLIPRLMIELEAPAAPMALQTVESDGPAMAVEIDGRRRIRPGDPDQAIFSQPFSGQTIVAGDAPAAFRPAETLEAPGMTISACLLLMTAEREAHHTMIDAVRIDDHSRLADTAMHKVTVDTGADHPGMRAVAREPGFGDILMTTLAVVVRRAEERIVTGAALGGLGGMRPHQPTRRKIPLTRS